MPTIIPHNKKIVEGSRISQITNSDHVRNEFNYTGNGIAVAIVDTGVDFSNLDIRDSLLRDQNNNHPVMLDSDGQGIILTNTTFYATIDGDGLIRNTTALPMPVDATSLVYRNHDGIYLDIAQKGKGTDVAIYNSFFPIAGDSAVFTVKLTNDIKIGNNAHDYIVSKSGYYHLGLIYQGALEGNFARLQIVPVLVVDANLPGVYDTIIPDMSTSWMDYTRYELPIGTEPKYDFDFTDEKPIVLGSGNEFLVYDSNNDGRVDYTAGTVGAQVLDVYGTIHNNTSSIQDLVSAVNGTLLSGLDPNGNYFGVMTDFQGHGTASAASIVSKGVNQYDLYNNTKKYSLVGVAPNAKILPIKSLWFGDTVYAWLWAAGFENKHQKWNYTGMPKADIISNSWGVSAFPNIQAAPGMDILSLILGVLSTPHSLDDDYPGVTMVVSAGNSGPGYGTMGTPNSSPFAISVGATTNNVFVGYGPFSQEPRFGYTTDHFNHVVDFSSRGPGVIGDPKPDLMSIGAHGFTPSTMLKLEKDSTAESFSLFGGTSMAGPLVAGSAAILMESMRDNKQDYDPFLIKNLLMSTATDLHNDALTQGSGLVNVKNAVKFVKGKDVFLVHNDASYYNIKKILDNPIEQVNATMLNLDRFQLAHKNFDMMSWFGGRISVGERSTATFTVENPTNQDLEIVISSQKLDLMKQSSYMGTTEPKLQDRALLDQEDAFRPNYIRLSDIQNFTDLGSYFDDDDINNNATGPIPPDSELMILNLHFAFDVFMNQTNDTYAEDLQISSLYVYDWVDHNNNTYVTSDELSMVSRGGSWGTVQELRISDPSTKFEGVPMVGVYPVPTKYSFWYGDSTIDAAPMNYTLTASHYKKGDWDPVWLEHNSIIVPPNDSRTVDATIVVSHSYETGVYQGFLKFSSAVHDVNVPVSFAVIQRIIGDDDTVVLVPGNKNKNNNNNNGVDVLHSPGYIKGSFDMTSRYMAGDWRQYYFDIQNPELNTAIIDISWENKHTNLAIFAVDPDGKIIQTNVPSGIFGHFMEWPSLDWLGTTPFSEGGGFFPTKNKDDTSAALYLPLNQTGTYSLLVHSTLFDGSSLTEPVTLSAKFITIYSDDPPPKIELMMPSIITNESIVVPVISDNDLDTVSYFANAIEIFIKDDNNGLDFSTIPNGNYILTITALDKADNYATKNFSFVKNSAADSITKESTTSDRSLDQQQQDDMIQTKNQKNDDNVIMAVDKELLLSSVDNNILIDDKTRNDLSSILSYEIMVPALIAIGVSILVFIKLGNSSKK